MNRNSVVDYLAYILLKSVGPIIRRLPLWANLFLGRRIGGLFYHFDSRHKAVAYANIKAALGDKLSPAQIKRVTKQFYRAFGQHFIEIFLIPSIDKKYLSKYMHIEGLHYIEKAFRRGKGVILLGMHEGSWELSNIVCANLGFAYNMFVRQQKYPRLGRLLDSYRTHQGCRIIQREDQLRQLVRALKNNQAIGMSIDQGGKDGLPVEFFGKDASMAMGAVRVALKTDAAIVPVFSARISGPHLKFMVEPPFSLQKTGDLEKDTEVNLQELVRIFEKYIRQYPQEYLWTYKVWKYAKEKNILILSDAKAGHLRQAEAAAKIAADYLKEKNIIANIVTQDVKFKNKFCRRALVLSTGLSGKYQCQGCLWCLRTFLALDSCESLIRAKPDVIISCGSALAPINYVLSRQSLAKSIVVMRPSFLSVRRFDLVLMPKHDHPPRRKNIVVTEGALNVIDEEYLKKQAERLVQLSVVSCQLSDNRIGLLIGGDTKNFHLDKRVVLEVIKQIKSISEKLEAGVLVTTSRRTAQEVEGLIKEEFQDYPRCKLLVIANEKNIPEAVGGILGLSQLIITSPESISMISEAVNSKKYVVVFDSLGLDKKHRRFLDYFAKNRYVYLTEADNLSNTIEGILKNKPAVYALKDNLLVREALEKIL